MTTDSGTPALPRSRFCGQCGSAADVDIRFCTSCGAQLADPHATAALPVQTTPASAPDSTTADEGTAPTVVLPATAAVPEQPAAEPVDSSPLGDLGAYEDDVVVDEAPAESTGRWTTRTIALVVVCALVLLGGGGYAAAGWLGGGQTRTALEESGTAFNGVVAAFAGAKDVDGVAAAAASAQPAAQRIAGHWRALDAAKDGVVVAQLKAEETLLLALAGLADVATEPLKTWGSQHEPIAGAVAAESESRAELARIDGDRAGDLADTAAMLTSVTAAVGTELAADATSRAGELLTTLGNATSTAGLRSIAAEAAEEKPAVAAALPALSADSGKPVLEAYDRVLAAFGPLSEIDGERTGGWAGARGDLASAYAQLATVSEGTSGAGLTTQSTAVLAAVDKVVDGAAGAIADWKAAHDAAVQARNADAAALESYTADFRAEIKSYELLRKDLQAFFDRVQDPNVSVYYYEAYNALDDAAEARRSVRAALTSLRVPEGLRAEHDRAVAVVTRAINAVQASYDGLSQAQDCFEYCFYRDTPGFKRFQSESDGISKEYAAAIAAWESAAEATKASVTNRALPPKPEV